MKHTSEGSTLALKPRVDFTRSPKTGISEAPQRGLMYFKNFDLKCIEVSQTPLVTAEEISKNLKFKAKSVTQKFQNGVLLTFQAPSAIRLCYSNNLILQVQNQGLFRRICFHYPGRPSM